MNWIFYAIFAQLVYTLVVFIDKYIVSKEVKDYQGMVIFTTIMGFLAGTIFWIVTGFPTLSWNDALVVMGTGILTIWGAYFYFKSISSDESSTVIILMQMIPVFVLFLAYIFLKESLTPIQLIGFALILASTSAVSLEGTSVKLKINPTFFHMIIVDIFWAAAAVLMKYATEANTFTKILPYESWGIGLGGATLYAFFPKVRNSFLTTLYKVKRRFFGIMMLNEVMFMVAKSLTFFAYFLGPVTLVSIISGTQVLFGILFGILLTLFLPKMFKEDMRKQAFLKKSIFAGFSLLGISMIS